MKKVKIATLGVLFVSFIWGVEFVLIHNAIAILPPHCFNVVRFGSATLFVGLCSLFWRKDGRISGKLLLHGALLGLLLCLGFTLQTFGLLYTSVSNCAFITSLNVVLVPFVAFFLLGDRLQVLTVAGVGIAAAGLYLLTGSGATELNIGDTLTLMGAVMFALHIVCTGKFSRQHDAMNLIFIQLLTVTILSLAAAVLVEDWQQLFDISVIGNPDVMWAILVASILGTGLAIIIQTLAQGHLSSTRVALIFALEPVFAAVTAVLVLNEQLPAAAVVGALLILGGILLSELKRLTGREASATTGE